MPLNAGGVGSNPVVTSLHAARIGIAIAPNRGTALQIGNIPFPATGSGVLSIRMDFTDNVAVDITGQTGNLYSARVRGLTTVATVATTTGVAATLSITNHISAGANVTIPDSCLILGTGFPSSGTRNAGIAMITSGVATGVAYSFFDGTNIDADTGLDQIGGANTISLIAGGVETTRITTTALKMVANAQIQAASGVMGFAVVATTVTLGSAGSVILPNANMSGAANDAARDTLAGNVNGAIAIDTGVTGRIYIRDAGSWKFVLAS